MRNSHRCVLYKLRSIKKLGLFGVLIGLFSSASLIAQDPTSYSLAPVLQFAGANGTAPNSLVLGSDGNFYGTTLVGGARGYGTVYKITPDGVQTILHSFCSLPNCADGGEIFAGVVEGTDGNFYGTTFSGGACEYQGGCGTVFKVTPTGQFTTLYNFAAHEDGGFCYGGLVLGRDGNFYGTTAYAEPSSGGTVFKITPGGTLTTLYGFCLKAGCADGSTPQASLVEDANGNFYGTTVGGGTPNNGGTVFKLSASGKLTTLHRFCAQRTCADGALPYASLAAGSNGKFYGTTYSGGAHSYGAVYTITASGVFAVLHSFDYSDGANPYAALLKGLDGRFFGTTAFGGANRAGTVFTIMTTGAVTVLHSFAITDGSEPQAPLVLGTSGSFYGTTSTGGTNGDGSVFRLTAQ